MKIRFTPVRAQPDVDRGLRVPYAPPQRQAHKIRWYIILLLVASPLLLLAYNLLASWWFVEAPGFVDQPVVELTAPQNAVVEAIQAQPESRVATGAPLLVLRDPQLDARLQGLEREWLAQQAALRASHQSRPAVAASAPDTGWLADNLRRYEQLFAAGAATLAEVNEARQRLAQARASVPPVAPAAVALVNEAPLRALETERARLLAARQSLTITAPAAGTVVRVVTRPGLQVQAGQALLAIQPDLAPRIMALVAPQDSRYAQPGQLAMVRWPSGERARARVLSLPHVSRPIPDSVRRLGEVREGIVTELALLDPVPARLRVDGLALTVRFPHDWSRWWPFSQD